MRRIAVINQKGGVGKTTTVCNLGVAVAARGKKVLTIDLDPQAHLTLHYGAEPATDRPSVYDVLVAGSPMDDAIIKVRKNVWLAPSHSRLAGAESERDQAREQVAALESERTKARQKIEKILGRIDELTESKV